MKEFDEAFEQRLNRAYVTWRDMSEAARESYLEALIEENDTHLYDALQERITEYLKTEVPKIGKEVDNEDSLMTKVKEAIKSVGGTGGSGVLLDDDSARIELTSVQAVRAAVEMLLAIGLADLSGEFMTELVNEETEHRKSLLSTAYRHGRSIQERIELLKLELKQVDNAISTALGEGKFGELEMIVDDLNQ